MRQFIWIGMIIASFGIAAAAAGEELNGPPSAGWDYSDPVNIAESRQWAALYWQWRDTGVVTQELSGFEFTNPIPSDLTPIDYAYDIFEQLYATELAALSTPEAPYSVIQLILDDPDVMQRFRVYTTTGLLSISFTQEQEASWSHLDMAAQAADGDGYSMDRAWIEDGSLLTQSLLGSPGSTALPPVTPPFEDPEVPDEIDDFDQDLKDLIRDCPLKDIDWRQDVPPAPGFDCDDFAISMAAWLRQLQQQYPDMQISLLLFWYDKDDGTRGGHAVTIVRIDGYYYIIDAQTGDVKGPYPAGCGRCIRCAS